MYQVLGKDRAHQRVIHFNLHQFPAHSRLKSFEPSFPAIADWNRQNLGIKFMSKNPFCRSPISFSRSQTSFE